MTDALNQAAAALLTRVGMRKETHFREIVFFNGSWGSESVFAILDSEWPATAVPRGDSAAAGLRP